jgi:hypothetical protein
MTVRTQLDFTRDTELGGILDLLDDHNGLIVDHAAHGPGGGNPVLTIEFQDTDSAVDFLVAVMPYETVEFLTSRVY